LLKINKKTMKKMVKMAAHRELIPGRLDI